MAHANEYRSNTGSRGSRISKRNGPLRNEVGQNQGYRSPGSQSAIRFVEKQRLQSFQDACRRKSGQRDIGVRPERRENHDAAPNGRRLEPVAYTDYADIENRIVATTRLNRVTFNSGTAASTDVYTIYSSASWLDTTSPTVTTNTLYTLRDWSASYSNHRSSDYTVRTYWGINDRHQITGQPLLRNLPAPINPPRVQITDDARARARVLLLSYLTLEQRAMYEREGKFRVVSNKGNIFEIIQGRMHNIYKLNMQGQRVENWCVLPQGELAECDVMLAQKIGLEIDEDHMWHNANISCCVNGGLMRRAPNQYVPGVRVPELRAN